MSVLTNEELAQLRELLSKVTAPSGTDQLNTAALEEVWSELGTATQACDDDLRHREVLRAWALGCEVTELWLYEEP